MRNPFNNLFSRLKKGTPLNLPEIETLLLEADMGVREVEAILEAIRQEDSKTSEEALVLIREKISEALSASNPYRLPGHRPVVFFLIGVNGAGKTTTIAKLAGYFQKQGLKSVLVGADTFRAAAAEQLKIWAERLGLGFVGGAANSDPSSVIFDGITSAKAKGADIVFVDTSGRLQTKAHLMEELKKMIRSGEKAAGRKIDEIWLILDANTGQNGLSQAMLFHEAAGASGVILTKFDGKAKGGILLSIARQTGLPIRFVGTGETLEDVEAFDRDVFAAALVES